MYLAKLISRSQRYDRSYRLLWADKSILALKLMDVNILR